MAIPQTLRLVRPEATPQPRRMAFTVKRLDALKAPATGRTYTYDIETPGLAVCVTHTGTRTYYHVRKIDGQAVRTRIAKVEDITLDDARTRAVMLNADAAAGINPVQRKREARQARTLGEVCRDYIEQHAKPHKRTWKEDERKIEIYLAVGRAAG